MSRNLDVQFKHAAATEQKQEDTQKSKLQFAQKFSVFTIQSDNLSVIATCIARDVFWSHF